VSKDGSIAIPGVRGLSLAEFGRRLWRAIEAHATTDSAAQLSYYALFSLFPFLFFLVTLTAWLPLGGAFAELLGNLSEVMPGDAWSLLPRHVAALLETPRPRLLTVGLGVTVWSASRGVDAMRKALNLAYDVRETRSFWQTQGVALVTTVLVSMLVLCSVAMIALGGRAGAWLAHEAGVDEAWQVAWSWLRWPATSLVFMLAAAVIYYVLPDVKQQFRYITPGSVVSTVLWLLSTWAFTQYVDHFGRFNVTYGSIGGVIVLLTWLYLSGLVLILGGEMNAVLEHASPGGKAAGARAPGEDPPPRWERPSAMPPAAVKGGGDAHRVEGSGTR
jgi:membrane protein